MPDNVTTEAVRYLLQQQELVRAPLRQIAVDTILNSEVTAPITGLPIIIAAFDTRAAGKEIANYVCTGVSDQNTWRQMFVDMQLNAFGGVGAFGWIVALDGTYNFDDSLLIDGFVPGKLLIQGDGFPRINLDYNDGGTDSTNALFNVTGGGVFSTEQWIRFEDFWFDGQGHSNGRLIFEWTLTQKPTIHLYRCKINDFAKNVWWSERQADRYIVDCFVHECNVSNGIFQYDSFSSGYSHVYGTVFASSSGDMVTGSFFSLATGALLLHDNVIVGSQPFLTKTPLDGVYYKDNLVNGSMVGGAGGGSSTVAYSGDLTPTTFAANQNDYNPTGIAEVAVLRLSSDASRDLTGIQGGFDGRILVLLNVGANPIVLKDEDANSTALNRFALPADITLAPDESATLQYDSTSARWRLIARGH